MLVPFRKLGNVAAVVAVAVAVFRFDRITRWQYSNIFD